MIEYCKSCTHDNDIGFCDKCFYNHILEEKGIPPTAYEAKPKPQINADRIRGRRREGMVYCDEMLAQAAADAISKMFNVCSYHDRPIFLAAVRATIDGAVATFDPESRAAYDDALSCMTVVTYKKPRQKAEGENDGRE